MRRPLLALALLAGAIGASAHTASTASNDVPTSTAVHRSTTVTGATLLSLGSTVTAGQITAVQPKLRGTGLLASTGVLGKVVTAGFGSDLAVVCTVTSSTLLDVLTGLAEATYDCPLLLEPADRPRPLRITAS